MAIMQDPYVPKIPEVIPGIPAGSTFGTQSTGVNPSNIGGSGSTTGGSVPVGGILGFFKKLFTGGGGGKTSTADKILGIASNVGSVLGKQQQGAAEGKQAQAAAQAIADRNAIELYQAQQTAQDRAATQDLERKKYETDNRSKLAKQALLGQLFGSGNYQGVSIDVPGVPKANVSGGILESLNRNPEALKALMTMGTQAGTAQTTPTSYEGGKILDAPKLTPVPAIDDGGFMDYLTRILQLSGAAGSAYDPRTGTPPTTSGGTAGRS